MTRLSDVSTGDMITASRQNDINDYINDGTEYVNTLSLQIGATEVIDSSRNVKNTATHLLPTGTSDPAGTEGKIYYKTDDDVMRIYDGAAWSSVGAGGAYAVTAKTSNYSLTAGDCNGFNVFTNDGAVATVKFTLPTAVAAQKVIIMNAESQTIRMQTGSGDKMTTENISDSTIIETSTKGYAMTFVNVDTTNWIAQSQSGTWSRINDPLAYYKFDDTVLDTVGSQDLTAYNTPTYATGKVGNAIDFEASSSQKAEDLTFSGAEDMKTIDFWVKPESISADQVIFYMGAATTANRFLCWIGTNNKVSCMMDKSSSNQFSMASTTDAAAGTWIHIIIVIGTGGAKMYVNGNTTPEDTDVSTSVMTTDFDRIIVGYDIGNNNYFDGLVDNLYLAKDQYSTADVTLSYNSGNGREF